MRVTVMLGVMCVAASLLAVGRGEAPHPSLAWMVHVDVQHLVVNVVTWMIFGAWIERRAGWRRMVLWVVAGAAVSFVSHAVVYPGHGRLFGMSSIGFFVFSAGVTAYALDRWWGRMLLVGMGLLLAIECTTGETGTRSLSGMAGIGETPRFVASSVHAITVSWVHAVCAAAGGVFGWLARASEPDVRLNGWVRPMTSRT